MSSETGIIDSAVATHLGGELIGALEAVVIANGFHGGQWSALYSFVSCGAVDLDALDGEISDAKNGPVGFYDHQSLDALRAYVEHVGDRGPQPIWEPRW